MINLLLVIFDVISQAVSLVEAELHGTTPPPNAVAVVGGNAVLCAQACAWCDGVRAKCAANRLA